MAAKFFTGIDLCNKELLRARFQNLSTAPTIYAAGMVYYDNSTANNTKGRVVLRSISDWQALAFLSDLDAYTPLTTYNALSGTVGGIDTRLKAVEAIFEIDDDGTINKWNEILAFLKDVDGDNLDTMLETFATKATSFTAGTGLTGTLKLDGTGTFSLASVGTAGTYYKVTTDAYGRVTSGVTSLAITDVDDLENRLKGMSDTIGGHTTAINTLGNKVNSIEVWYESVGKYFKRDSEGVWYVDGDFYTKGQLSAGGIGEADGGGSGIILDYDAIVDALKYVPTKKVTGTITANGAATQTITHNLNTRDVIVQIFEPSSPYELIYADVKVNSTTQVQITFAEAPTKAYKVVIIG